MLNNNVRRLSYSQHIIAMKDEKRIFRPTYIVLILVLIVCGGAVGVRLKISHDRKIALQKLQMENKKKYEMQLIEQARNRQLDKTKMTNTSPNNALEPTPAAP